MPNTLLEIFRAIVVGIILFYIIIKGRNEDIRKHKGWSYILLGFSLIFFATVLAISDDFPSLNKFIIIANTNYALFLKMVVGYLFGYICLVIGFFELIPTIVKLKKTEKKPWRLSS